MSRTRGWLPTYFHAGTLPYWSVHVAAIVGVAIVGFSWTGLLIALACYFPRLFFVTAGYHRYFSHRSFKTSRWFQFVLAFGAVATAQKGPLWWAANHRRHHKLSDQPGDLHSVVQSGFWWAHHGWILGSQFDDTDFERIRDFAKYPELRWLDRWWIVPPFMVGAAIAFFGGWEMFVWAFCVSQVLTWHGTFTINSLSHLWGSRRYATTDDSRNNAVLAVITLGEGWHNNHHHYQVSARQGFFWWEIDITYYALRALSAVRLIWDVHGVPDHIRNNVDDTAASVEAPLPTKSAA